MNGSIDLLLETAEGYVVIDHKMYGNPDEAAIKRHAEQYLPQLAAYGAAIEELGTQPVREYWLHFGVGGVCLRCGIPSRVWGFGWREEVWPDDRRSS